MRLLSVGPIRTANNVGTLDRSLSPCNIPESIGNETLDVRDIASGASARRNPARLPSAPTVASSGRCARAARERAEPDRCVAAIGANLVGELQRDSLESGVPRILLLGPDDDSRRALHLMLDRAGRTVMAMADLASAVRHLADSTDRCEAAIVTADLVGRAAHALDAPVIGIAATRDVGASEALFLAGAADVIAAPLDELELATALRHVASWPRRAATSAVGSSTLVGASVAMQRVRSMIEQIARHRSTVLVLGESGTGKELVARAIHDASPRRERRFVAVNCAAIPAALLESELFGHKRGAFTDAVRDRAGLFEDADGGTLFLDEIGELPLALQAKLLRVLQEGEIRRVGDTVTTRVDVRLIAATLRDLADEVAAGRFREDLFYRLNVVPITLPPLRDRADDIPELAQAFARRHAARHGLGDLELGADVIDALGTQPWPGNVRELENVIERAVVLADGVVDRAFLGTVMVVKPDPGPAVEDLSIKKATRDLEQDLIKRALGATSGNRTNAAKLLEISHRALLYKMKEYGIS